MRIIFHCGGMPFNGDTPNHSSLGGSETACWAIARELAKRDHSVTVFTNGEPGKFDGVTYENCGQATERSPLGESFHFYAENAPCDVLVIQRNPTGFASRFASKINILWTHDLGLKRYQSQLMGTLWNVDEIFTVSEWHAEQLRKVYDLPENAVWPTTNGIYGADFAQNPITSDDTHRVVTGLKSKKILTFSHRPERGLEHLVREGGIMERLGDEFHLIACHYDNTTPQMADYYNHLFSRCEALENVTLLPPQKKADLYQIMRKAWLHVYPSNFEETSCITAMETQAAGLPIICSYRGALPETLSGQGADFVPLTGGMADEDAFVKRIKKLARDTGRYDSIKTKCDPSRYEWAGVAEKWEGHLEEMLAAKSENAAALARHYLRHDDITALKNMNAEDVPSDVAVTLASHYGEWTEDQEAYRQHYREYYEWEYGRDNAPHYVPIDDHPRTKSTVSILERLPEGSRVLDLGPAEGSFTLALARALPGLEFICVELEERNLALLCKHIEETGAKNVTAIQGDHDALPEEAHGCDALLMAEVLEHLISPDQAVWDIAQDLAEEPLVVITVPYGPWGCFADADGEKWRVHLHHFEPADLKDMFGTQEGYRLALVPNGHTPWGEALGNYVVSFTLDKPEAIAGVNYTRKRSQAAPKETLAVCMIARDAAHTIGKTLQSVADIADEIWVAVDADTVDNTREVAEAVSPKVRTISIPSPTGIGFDEARNMSISGTDCDWILWIDSDEELIHPERIPKYLRANPIMAYSIPQHHLSVEPLGCMKTDLPSRLFRNNHGIRFYGRVHEHPELEMNEGLGLVITLGDVSISHPAYLTEDVRRSRFMRNWPLMRADRQVHPDRKLRRHLSLRDLSYVIRDFKHNTLPVPPQALGMTFEDAVAEAEEEWQAILDYGQPKLIIDSLQFWSLVNEMMGRGFTWVGTTRGASLNGQMGEEEVPIQGRFLDRKELMRILDVVTAEQVDPLTGEYV